MWLCETDTGGSKTEIAGGGDLFPGFVSSRMGLLLQGSVYLDRFHRLG